MLQILLTWNLAVGWDFCFISWYKFGIDRMVPSPCLWNQHPFHCRVSQIPELRRTKHYGNWKSGKSVCCWQKWEMVEPGDLFFFFLNYSLFQAHFGISFMYIFIAHFLKIVNGNLQFIEEPNGIQFFIFISELLYLYLLGENERFVF